MDRDSVAIESRNAADSDLVTPASTKLQCGGRAAGSVPVDTGMTTDIDSFSSIYLCSVEFL